jgi:hypothetical protein
MTAGNSDGSFQLALSQAPFQPALCARPSADTEGAFEPEVGRVPAGHFVAPGSWATLPARGDRPATSAALSGLGATALVRGVGAGLRLMGPGPEPDRTAPSSRFYAAQRLRPV